MFYASFKAYCHGHAQGTTIEVTLWRELAEKFYDYLEEGRVWPPHVALLSAAGRRARAILWEVLTCVAACQVYYFKRGTVKLANRDYQNLRNDYIIHMDNGWEPTRAHPWLPSVLLTASCS